MDSRWFKDATLNKEERQKQILSYKNAFDTLLEILHTMEEKPSVRDYDSPSWSHKQADQNGANRKLREVIKLITLTKDK